MLTLVHRKLGSLLSVLSSRPLEMHSWGGGARAGGLRVPPVPAVITGYQEFL